MNTKLDPVLCLELARKCAASSMLFEGELRDIAAQLTAAAEMAEQPALTARFIRNVVVAAVDGGLVYGDRHAGYQCNDGALDGLADELIAASRPADTTTADEVRAVVRGVIEDVLPHSPYQEIISHRSADKLAGRVVALSAEDRASLTYARDQVHPWHEDARRAVALLDRLLGSTPCLLGSTQ